MGTGYIRNDTSNNIADGKVIDAADFDGEFDALVDAFDAATGHTHDGTSAEGAPITVTGPAQEYVSDGTALFPKTDDTYDLGKTGAEWKDLYVDGTANIDSLVADTADINGGTVDGVVVGGSTAAAGTFTTLTSTGNTVLGDAATDTVTVNADVASDLIPSVDGTYDLGAVGSEWQDLFVDGTANIDSLVADTADINGGTVDGAVINNSTIGASTPAAGTFTTLSVSTSSTIDLSNNTSAGDLAVADGGTGSSTASGARTNLGLVIGTDVQAYDAELAALAGLTSAANKVPYFTGSGTAGLLDFKDEDNMVSDSATSVPSQQSVKAYVDNSVGGVSAIPTGVIVMWSGSVATVPSGWALCDGTAGTPDLTGRFVVHADADTGGTYAPGDTGGADSVTLDATQIPGHTHTFSASTSSAGSHSHTVPISTTASAGGPSIATSSTVANATETTSSAGAHTHSVSGTTSSTGGGGNHENRPPYYALAYIMKT